MIFSKQEKLIFFKNLNKVIEALKENKKKYKF
jgi:hypothetical protein